MNRRLVILAIAAGALVCVSGFWWLCQRDDGTPFLPAARHARWIVYPKPPDTNPHRFTPISALFRRTFNLPSTPLSATLSIRAFRQGAITINGQVLNEVVLSEHGWKRARSIDIGKFLRAGENEIVVAVTNSFPPGLWASIELGNGRVSTDQDWQVSLLGTPWQQAALADASPSIRAGNYFFEREQMSDSLRRIWPEAVGMALIAGLLLAAVRLPRLQRLADPPLALLIVILILWAALFVNNLPQLERLLGFDRDGHLQYIDYILQKKALPLADEGWQMYQPPLFYLLSAIVVAPFESSATTDAALLELRAFSALIGIAHLVLVFLCLRLLFPRQSPVQMAGLLVAGFLSANLCLAHQITNETLAALFVTAAIYFSLRLLGPHQRPMALRLGLGTSLGLALLTKFSAILAVPFLLALVAWAARLRPNGGKAGSAIGFACPVLAVMLLVCGWHFLRVGLRFGNPLIGNWDPKLPFAWWQDPGSHTAGWYAAFGEVFKCPLFSSINSFADGMYSTLWGDGLCGGSARMDFRPQWNFHLMNLGYLTAIAPTILVLGGIIACCVRFVRKPTPETFLILGALFSFALGILFMSLRVPSYAQVKAFYGLPALVPFCALGAIGLQAIGRGGAVVRLAMWLGLLAWAITSYGSLWIPASSPFTHTVRGVGFNDDGRYAEAAEEFSRALQLEPTSLHARVGLADSLNRLSRREEARQEADRALQLHPDSVEAWLQQGVSLGLDGRYEQAAEFLRRAAGAASDHPTVYQALATCYTRLGQHQKVVEACEHGLRIDPFNPELHYALAVTLTSHGDAARAAEHFQYGLILQPERVEALNNLAWILASNPSDKLRNGQEAVRLAERACELTQQREPTLLGTLAAAYAEAGRFADAVRTGRKAEELAAASGQPEVAEKNRQLIVLYQAGKAYREPR